MRELRGIPAFENAVWGLLFKINNAARNIHFSST